MTARARTETDLQGLTPEQIEKLTFLLAEVSAHQATVWWALVGIAVSSAANGPYNVTVTTLFHSLVDDDLLGRVGGVESTGDAVVTVAASCATAVAVAAAGPRVALVGASLVGAAISAIGQVGIRGLSIGDGGGVASSATEGGS